MFRKLCFILMLFAASVQMANAQKKEISLAKDNVKAGKSLEQAEASMRKLLADSTNRNNEKIWLVLFDAVRKQYEAVNEKMYLKQSADTAKLFAATYRMFGILEGLDSIDAKPDKKGRVKIAYRKRHAEYLNALRPNLYNAAIFHTGKKEYQKAYDYFAAYIDCARQPLFSDYNYSSTDKLLPRAAFYALFNGYKTNKAEQTLRFAPIAIADTAKLETTYQYLVETYRAQNDTLKCLDVLQKGFERYPKTSYFFSHLFDHYFRSGDMKRAVELCDGAVAADSLNSIALFAKSSVLFAQKRYDECIAVCDRIIKLDKQNSGAYLNAGLSYFNQAVELDILKNYKRDQRSRMLQLYRKALPYMQTYRKLAPKEQVQWAMPLYTIYLNLNMGKEFDEIDSLMKGKKK